MKKIIAFLLVVSLTATVAIGGTLAFLTDRDSEANVFTVGNVEIDLNEDFEQGAELIPGVTIPKEPTVTNVGPNDAYVWATVAVPKGLASVIEFDGKGTGWEAWTEGTTTIEGKDYVLYTVLHTNALAKGDVTTALFETVALDETVDIDPEGVWHTVENGEVDKNGALGWTNADGNPVIYVSAYAIQTEGLTDTNGDTVVDVKDAYATYNTQWADKGTEWGTPATVTTADDKAGLKDAVTGAVAAGATDVIVDMEGANAGDLDYGITKDMVPEGTTVTIKNAVFNGQSYGNAVDGTVIFENCTFTNDWAYSIHFDAGKGNVIFNNCTLEGWCSFGSAIQSVEMNNCAIKGNASYAMYRFYQDTVLTNCTIDCSNSNTTDGYADGISAVNGAVVELNGCTITYADYEVAENAKIVVDGTTVAESVNNSEVVIKNADR